MILIKVYYRFENKDNSYLKIFMSMSEIGIDKIYNVYGKIFKFKKFSIGDCDEIIIIITYN